MYENHLFSSSLFLECHCLATIQTDTGYVLYFDFIIVCLELNIFRFPQYLQTTKFGAPQRTIHV